MEDIASRLKRVRGKRSAKDFAALIGCSMQTIYRYEWGERVPDDHFLQMVANKTGVSLEWLIAGEGSPDLSVLEAREEYSSTIPPSVEPLGGQEPCAQCAKLESRLEKMEERLEMLEQERREVSAENRQLHQENAALLRENGSLREKLARFEAERDKHIPDHDNEGDFSSLFDEHHSTVSSSREPRAHK